MANTRSNTRSKKNATRRKLNVNSGRIFTNKTKFLNINNGNILTNKEIQGKEWLKQYLKEKEEGEKELKRLKEESNKRLEEYSKELEDLFSYRKILDQMVDEDLRKNKEFLNMEENLDRKEILENHANSIALSKLHPESKEYINKNKEIRNKQTRRLMNKRPRQHQYSMNVIKRLGEREQRKKEEISHFIGTVLPKIDKILAKMKTRKNY